MPNFDFADMASEMPNLQGTKKGGQVEIFEKEQDQKLVDVRDTRRQENKAPLLTVV